jgi:hypothetical protein
MTSTTRDILWMLKQMQSTIGNIRTREGAPKLNIALAQVYGVLSSTIQAFEQAIVMAEETKDETTSIR